MAAAGVPDQGATSVAAPSVSPVPSAQPPASTDDAHGFPPGVELEAPFDSLIQKIVESETKEEREFEAENLRFAVEMFWRSRTRHPHRYLARKLDAIIHYFIRNGGKKRRLAAIAMLTAFVKLSNEAYQDRVMRAEFSLRELESEEFVAKADLEASEASVMLLVKFAIENDSKPVKRYIENLLELAFFDMVHFDDNFQNATDEYLRARTARNSLLISKLAPLFPERFAAIGTLKAMRQILRRVSHHDECIRAYTVKCIVAMLSFCARPKPNSKSTPSLPSVIDMFQRYFRRFQRNDRNEDVELSSERARNIHGCLSLARAMMEDSVVREFAVLSKDGLYDTFLCDVLRLRNAQSVLVQTVVARTLPALVESAVDRFCASKIDAVEKTFSFLTMQVKNSELSSETRSEAVVALGRVVKAIDCQTLERYLGSLFDLAGDLLSAVLHVQRLGPQAAAADSGVFRNDVLRFLGNVAEKTPPKHPCFRMRHRLLLAKMFETNISVAMVDVLKQFVVVDPELDEYVQNVLMRRVEKVLKAASENEDSDTDKHSPVNGLFVRPTRLNASMGYVDALGIQSARISVAGSLQDIALPDTKYKLELLMDLSLHPNSTGATIAPSTTPQIALNVLTTFPFNRVPSLRLAWFANSHLVNFLESTSIIDRRLAVQACLNLMRYAIANESGGSRKVRDSTFMILSQIVSVAVVDPSRRVRLTALEMLDCEEFGRYLAQQDTLPRLAMCLQDEDIWIRKRALLLMCRLRKEDSAVADPLLGRFVYHLLTVLRCPVEMFAEMGSQATSLLAVLVQEGGDLVLVHGPSLVEVIMIGFNRNLRSLASFDSRQLLPVLLGLKSLATNAASAPFLGPHADTLVEYLVDILQDVDLSVRSVRLAVIEALMRVVQLDPLTVRPYDFDPRLFGRLVSSLKKERDEELRVMTLNLLGAIGAVSPDKEDTKYASLPSDHIARTHAEIQYRISSDPRYGEAPYLLSGTAGPSSDAAQSVAGDTPVVGNRHLGPTFGNTGGRDLRLQARSVAGRAKKRTPAALAAAKADKAAEVAKAAQAAADTAAAEAAADAADLEDGVKAGVGRVRNPPRLPLVNNAVRGDDFAWIESAMGVERPSWNKNSLTSFSLVNRLTHPFTDSDIYFPSIVLDVLLEIAATNRMTAHHLDAVHAMKTLLVDVIEKPKSLYFLREVVPRILWMINPAHTGGPCPITDYRACIFDHLSELVRGVKELYEEFLPDTVTLCHAYLVDRDKLFRNSAVEVVTNLLKSIRINVGDIFRPYAVYLFGPMITVLLQDRSASRHISTSVISTLGVFGDHLSHHVEFIFPALVLVFQDESVPRGVRRLALETTGSLARQCGPIGDLISTIIHPLVRALATIEDEATVSDSSFDAHGALAKAAASALREVALAAPSEFVVFVPTVAKALVASGIGGLGEDARWSSSRGWECRGLEAVLLQCSADIAEGILQHEGIPEVDADGFGAKARADALAELCQQLENDFRIATESLPSGGQNAVPVETVSVDATANQASRLVPNSAKLLDAFEIDDSFQSADWQQWMDGLGVALLLESGDPAMRTMGQLAERNELVGRHLFNAAFLSCWPKLEPVDVNDVREQILKILERSLMSPTIPMGVKQSLLDLFEFMDHDERPLPIRGNILTKAAMEVGAHAKALRSRETAFTSCTTPEQYQAVLLSADSCGLIEAYHNLGHKVSAVGTLNYFEKLAGSEVAERVKRQYNETLSLLPAARNVYQKVQNKCQGQPSLAQVGPSSYENGKRLFQEDLHLKEMSELSPALAGYAPVYGEDGKLQNPLSASELKAAGLEPGDFVDLNWYVTLSKMRVLDKLGEWRVMEDEVEKAWEETKGNQVARVGLATTGRACSVAFDLSLWKEFEERVGVLSDSGAKWDTHFYNSLLCVQKSAHEGVDATAEAKDHIKKARKILEVFIRTRASESYQRAYNDFLNAQHLIELEEMVRYIKSGVDRSPVAQFRDVWNHRLRDCRPDQHTWYSVLMIRSLLFRPIDDKTNWLLFVTKCRKDKRLPMATEALRRLIKDVLCTELRSRFMLTSDGLEDWLGRTSDNELLQHIGRFPKLSRAMELIGEEDGRALSPEQWSRESVVAIPDTTLQFAVAKHIWACGRKKDAYLALEECVKAHPHMQSRTPGESRFLLEYPGNPLLERDLFGEIYLKLSKWSRRLCVEEADGCTSRAQALSYSQLATEWKPNWAKAWHNWATFNWELADVEVRRMEGDQNINSMSHTARRLGLSFYPDVLDFDAKLPRLPPVVVSHLKIAVVAFFRAIKHGGKTTLEDVLTVLRLWFKFGGCSDAGLALIFNSQFEKSDPIHWLDVIPQIIARLHSKERKVREGVESLLRRIGFAHPQAVVYPLTVAFGSQCKSRIEKWRRNSAAKVLDQMREKHRALVDQAQTVATELDKVAVLYHEKWYERIEEASRYYYAEQNALATLEVLAPLHEEMEERPPVTDSEKKFVKKFGEDLAHADRLGQQVIQALRERPDVSNNPEEQKRRDNLMEQAWAIYFKVFREVQRAHDGLTSLEMAEVSPKLAGLKDLRLAIPGTYKPSSGSSVKIASFASRMDIIPSKQRPRKLGIVGDDGIRRAFLLKGHDDLRQDERIMQVFGLMNAHLAHSEDRSVREGAQLVRYTVIALSSSAGLIELVRNTDTMHALVKEYRENRKVMANVEFKVMARVAAEHEKLPLMNRVDLFQFMLDNTGGRDISRVLWLRSRNSEMWLERRTNFARTLATSSIAGYIVGLGDRHPSNIMIRQNTGKVMHIDFGDCFEVAMRRDKFPEKIPFRLTRMLVHALEPCGVEGHFRHMAVGMLKVLRQEATGKAIVSMMEAFVYDPLLRQKLLDNAEMQRLDKDNDEDTGMSRMGATPSRQVSEQYAEAGSLAGMVRMQAGGDVSGDGLEPVGPTPSQRSRSHRETMIERCGDSEDLKYRELAKSRAKEAIYRVYDKLNGVDFDDTDGPLSVEEQFERLVEEAQNVEYLCQLFSGYVPQW